MVLFGLGPGRCCERRGCPGSPAQCPWTRELTRFEAERRAVSEGGGWENTVLSGGADKSDWFKGQVCGEEKAIGECEGGGQPKSSPGLYPEDRGGPKGKTGSGWGQERNQGRGRAGQEKDCPAWERGREQVGPWGRGGGHLRRPLPLRAQGRLWAASDVRRRPPSGLISSGGERHFLGSLSDSVCISCGRAGHLCWTRRTGGWGRGGRRGGGKMLGREPGDTTVFYLVAAGASASPVHEPGRGAFEAGPYHPPAPHKSPCPPAQGQAQLPCPRRALPGRCTGSLTSGMVGFRCACLLPPSAWPAPGLRPHASWLRCTFWFGILAQVPQRWGPQHRPVMHDIES